MQRSPDIQSFLTQLLTEDIGQGDMTSAAIIAEDAQAHYAVVAREDMVLGGVNLAVMLFSMMDENIEIKPNYVDGALLKAGATLIEVRGLARAILAAERVALNLLQHLCGVATLSAQYVQAVQGLPVRIADTRKTIPGLRELQKYAVRCGGGANHRMGLDDGVLIKDNHIAIIGSIAEAVSSAKAATPLLTKIEVECDTLDQVQQAVKAGVDVVLLDNMDLDMLKQAVAIAKAAHITSEASGNISLETVRDVAQTGVDIISVGKLTHSARAVDIGLDIVTAMPEKTAD
jgi:nicotinate-nucleotide pyrophosphorylase (carboxylating)